MNRQRPATWVIMLSLLSGLLPVAIAQAEPEAKHSAAPAASTAPVPSKDAAPATSPANAAKKEFKPPYPNRVHLFEPPEGAFAQPNSSMRQTVLLKGFVNFTNEPARAVLLVNDKIVHLAPGETFAGLQLVSTTPPIAVVKNNEEQRWTLNLLKQIDPRSAVARTAPRPLMPVGNRSAATDHTAGSRGQFRLGGP